MCRQLPSAFLCEKKGLWTYESEVSSPGIRRISAMCEDGDLGYVGYVNRVAFLSSRESCATRSMHRNRVQHSATSFPIVGRGHPPLSAHTEALAGTQEASAEHFRACVEVEDEPAQRLRALIGLGVSYDKLGDGPAAVLALREAVTLAPSDVRAKVSVRRPRTLRVSCRLHATPGLPPGGAHGGRVHTP